MKLLQEKRCSSRDLRWLPAGYRSSRKSGKSPFLRITLVTITPYADSLFGDWLEYPKDGSVHTSQVYLNGMALYEAKSLEELACTQQRTTGMSPDWSNRIEYIPEPEKTVYQWFAQMLQDGSTAIHIRVQDEDPNLALTEINVRKCCFYPEKAGRNFITVRGFEMAHAAVNWAPPTGEQLGLLGAHWSWG